MRKKLLRELVTHLQQPRKNYLSFEFLNQYDSQIYSTPPTAAWVREDDFFGNGLQRRFQQSSYTFQNTSQSVTWHLHKNDLIPMLNLVEDFLTIEEDEAEYWYLHHLKQFPHHYTPTSDINFQPYLVFLTQPKHLQHYEILGEDFLCEILLQLKQSQPKPSFITFNSFFPTKTYHYLQLFNWEFEISNPPIKLNHNSNN